MRSYYPFLAKTKALSEIYPPGHVSRPFKRVIIDKKILRRIKMFVKMRVPRDSPHLEMSAIVKTQRVFTRGAIRRTLAVENPSAVK
jgi:hypothetical protein